MKENKSTMEDKKFLAKILYTTQHIDAKVIAAKVGVSEKTMSNWVNDGNWKALRNRLLISKEYQINQLYGQLENLNNAIEENDKGYADTKQADILIKLTAAIRNMETDLAIADLVESGMRFIKHIQKIEPQKTVIEISELWHSFIQSSIRK